MELSLSVRIAESVLNKEEANRSMEHLADLAQEIGYSAMCMRASQAGIKSPLEQITAVRKVLDDRGLPVSMITGDIPIPANDEHAPDALRNITPYLDLAELLDADLIRIGMKTEEDIAWARWASDEAEERDIRLAHQSHTRSLFETVEESVSVLKQVGERTSASSMNRPISTFAARTTDRKRSSGSRPGSSTSICRITAESRWIHDPEHLGTGTRASRSGAAPGNGRDRLSHHHADARRDRLRRLCHRAPAFAELMEPEDAARQSYDYLTSIADF